MMIPDRTSDENLIAELPPTEFPVLSKITIIFCREQLIDSILVTFYIYIYIYISILYIYIIICVSLFYGMLNNVNLFSCNLTTRLKVFEVYSKFSLRIFTHVCHSK